MVPEVVYSNLLVQEISRPTLLNQNLHSKMPLLFPFDGNGNVLTNKDSNRKESNFLRNDDQSDHHFCRSLFFIVLATNLIIHIINNASNTILRSPLFRKNNSSPPTSKRIRIKSN